MNEDSTEELQGSRSFEQLILDELKSINYKLDKLDTKLSILNNKVLGVQADVVILDRRVAKIEERARGNQ